MHSNPADPPSPATQLPDVGNIVGIWDSFQSQRFWLFAMSAVYAAVLLFFRGAMAIGFGVSFVFGLAGWLLVVCSVLLCARRIRNSLMFMTIMVYVWVVISVTSCIGLIVFITNGSTPAGKMFGIESATKIELLVLGFRVQVVPFFTTIVFFTIGMPMRVCVIPSILLFSSFGVLVAIIRAHAQDQGATDSVTTILTNLYLCATTLFFGWTAEKHQQAARTNLSLVGQTMSQWISQKESDRLTRTRIVSYIFHEVRNPLNNILLASDLLTTNIEELQRKATHNNSIMTSSSSSECAGITEDLKEMHEMLDTISKAAGSACHVLNDALSLQKLETGSFEFVKKPFSLLKFQEQAVRVATPQMQQKQINFVGIIDPALRSISVVGDFNRLQQVVNNFLSNAYKFTPQYGSVELRMSYEGETVAGDARIVTVRTCVKDSGPGIDHSDHSRVFQAWSQIRASDLQQGQGSGLGLSLCKAFVEVGHGGKIGFTSELGEGACFYFEVDLEVASEDCGTESFVQQVNNDQDGEIENSRPQQRGVRSRLEFASARVSREQTQPKNHLEMTKLGTVIAQPQQPTSSSPSITRHEQPPSPNPPQRANNYSSSHECIQHRKLQTAPLTEVTKSVLLVDDSLVTRKLISKIFGAIEVSFDTCENGQQAVDKILCDGCSYQLILMDKEMPVMDGFDATRSLRAGGYVFPVVGLTGNAMDDQVRDFVAAGADEVYSKPIGRPELVKVLTKYQVLQPQTNETK